MRKVLVALFMLMCSNIVSAQTLVRGVVVDQKEMQALPGTSVSIKNSTSGVITNAKGEFAIELPSSDCTILFSFIGYKTQQYMAGELMNRNNKIYLLANKVGLDEIIVQASISNKRSLKSTSSAVSYINVSDEMEKSGNADLVSLLSSGVEGLQVHQVNGKVGSAIKFNVRSGASFSTMRDPLIFVDGVRLITANYSDVTTSQDAMSALNDLNMDDMASIQVLKGAAASASYGAEAANGVILLTSKKGLPGKMRVNAKLSTVLTKSADDYDYLVNSKPVNDFFQTGFGTFANLDFSGKTDRGLAYYSSFNLKNAESHVPGNTDKRYGMRLNLNKKSDWYELGMNTQYTVGDLNVPMANESKYSATWNLTKSQEPWPFLTEEAWEGIETTYNNNRFIGSVQAKIKPMKNWTVFTKLGYDQNNVFGTQLYPYGFTYGAITQGRKTESTHKTSSLNFEIGTAYLWRINDWSNIKFSLISQATTYKDEINSIEVQDFPTYGITGLGTAGRINSTSQDVYEKRTQGYYGEIIYALNEKLFLGAGLRRDASNLIGNNVSSIWYPQVNAAYVFEDIKYTDQLKLRIAAGESGRLPNPYDAQTSYTGVTTAYGSGFDYNIKGNPDIKPERTREIEMGFDWSLKSHSLSFTYYHQKTSNSIVYSDLPPSAGWASNSSKYAENIGEVKGYGFEIAYKGTLYNSPNQQFGIDVFANLSTQKNEVVSTGGKTLSYWATTIQEGLPVYAFFSQKDTGAIFDETTGEYIGRDTQEAEYLGKPFPDCNGSFGVDFKLFKDLQVSALFNYALGFQIYNISHRNIARSGDNYKPKIQAKQNMDSYAVGSDEYKLWANEYAKFGDVRGDYIQDGDFLRLSNLSVSYNLTSVFKNMGLNVFDKARITFSGNNLWLTSKYKGSDPEVDGTGGSSLTRGLSPIGTDYTSVPRARTFVSTLQFSF